MFSRSLTTLLSIVVLLAAIAQATWFDNVVRILARQNLDVVTLSTSTATRTSTRSSSQTGNPSTTPSASPTTSATVTTAPSTTPSSSSDIPPSATESSTDGTSPAPSSSSTDRSQTASSSESRTTEAPTPTTRTTVVIVTSDGTTSSSTSEIVETPSPTSSASLNSDGSTKKSSGMSSSTRDTIIGVVVGIGGAILLIAGGVVAWRIWGRRRNTHDADEDPMTGMAVGAGPNERIESSSGNRMFQDTLEKHHAQPQPTTATNF